MKTCSCNLLTSIDTKRKKVCEAVFQHIKGQSVIFSKVIPHKPVILSNLYLHTVFALGTLIYGSPLLGWRGQLPVAVVT